jgi:succinoglycan biosynthesis transport protein ExoP
MIVQPSFRESILTFFRRKFTFLLVFGAVCLGGAGYLLVKTPMYLSSAALVLRFDQQQTVPDIDRTRTPQQPLGSNERREILYSDADILRSPDLARRAIASVGLARVYPKIAADGHGEQRQMDEALQAFGSDMLIDVGLQSDVINLSFLNPDPQVAHTVVQSMLEHFFSQEAVIYANPQLQFSEDEAKRAQEKLAAAQSALSQFREAHKISDLSAQVGQLLQQRTDVESRLATANGVVQEAQQKEAAYKELLAAVPPLLTTTAAGETYRGVDEVQGQLATLKAKRDQMAATYRPGSPVFESIDASIASLQRDAKRTSADARSRSATQPNLVYENIRTDLMRASAEAQGAREPAQILATQLGQINQRLADLDAERTHNDDLQRAVRIQDDTYRTLAIRSEESRVEANRNAEKISAAAVIAAPSLPQEPARPRRKLVALGTILAGLIVACSAVLGAEALDDRLRSPHDVAHVLRLPVLATFARDA